MSARQYFISQTACKEIGFHEFENHSWDFANNPEAAQELVEWGLLEEKTRNDGMRVYRGTRGGDIMVDYLIDNQAERGCPFCGEQYWVTTVNGKIADYFCGNPTCAIGEEAEPGAWDSWQRFTGAMKKALATPPHPQTNQ